LKKSFISAFFEKEIMHSFKHISYMHFPKTKSQKFHKRVLKKNNSIFKRKIKEKKNAVSHLFMDH